MSPTSTSGGYHFRRLTGGEHISRLVETRSMNITGKEKDTIIFYRTFSLFLSFNLYFILSTYCFNQLLVTIKIVLTIGQTN